MCGSYIILGYTLLFTRITLQEVTFFLLFLSCVEQLSAIQSKFPDLITHTTSLEDNTVQGPPLPVTFGGQDLFKLEDPHGVEIW